MATSGSEIGVALELGSMQPLDTSPAARARQLATYRRMTPERRLAAAAEMCDEVRAVTEDGIRHRHPEYSDAEVRAALVAILMR
jgi:hypothetical protein